MILNFLDAALLARIQFAFTVSFHIIFPSFTIGLASWLAIIELLWLRTGNNVYEQIYRMWVKIFAVCFGMGVVSGVVLSYQFGTNWSVFSDKIANVIGPLLGYEVLTAFFLESSFLGIMLFGMKRVSKRMHFASTCIVAVGTIISAFWILSANSWMQTPQGFEIDQNGLLYPTSWMDIIFNPSFSVRFFHMITAAYLTTAFVIAGVSAYYLWKKVHVQVAKIMFGMAMLMAIFVTPLQIVIGHMHGENTMHHQPLKVAAMEGNWDRGGNKPLYLFGIPNEEKEITEYGISIPGGASFILTWNVNGEIPGLKDVPKSDRPPVAFVFWSFRVMVAIGFAMLLTGIIGAFLYFKKRLFNTKAFQFWCMAMTPVGFIAVLAGWFVTEVGRQPWSVYGIIRTSDGISPVIAEQIAITLIGFIIVYTFIFGAGSFYILKLITKGPVNEDSNEKYYDHSKQKSLIEAITTTQGNKND
ncbi:MAG: cytochrome ubiquinol oxidase subunit I [Proteobacteria bacterium]|nr:cytochrome ubiquinol oxidase subunit I [Pseudomonadota bacterium]